MDASELMFDALRGLFYLGIVVCIFMGITSGLMVGLKTAAIVFIVLPLTIIVLAGIIFILKCILQIIHWVIFG